MRRVRCGRGRRGASSGSAREARRRWRRLRHVARTIGALRAAGRRRGAPPEEDADAAASELAVFGSFLAASPDDGGEVLINEVAGMGARTRPASASHPLAAGLGYGALSCVAVH